MGTSGPVLRRSQSIGNERKLLAQRVDELIDFRESVGIVQAEFELVAEQRAQALAVADSFDQRQGDANAIGGEIDGKLSGVVAVGLSRDKSGAQYGGGVRVRDGGSMDEAAVVRVGHQRRRAGKLRGQVGRQLRGRQQIGGGMKILDPGIRAEVKPAWLLVSVVRCELALDMR